MVKKIMNACCTEMNSKESVFPDHSSEINRINRMQGQLEGIKKMIQDRRYCPEIITQTSAIRAAILSLESSILKRHLTSCVREAFKANAKDSEAKIEELLEIFKRSAQ